MRGSRSKPLLVKAFSSEAAAFVAWLEDVDKRMRRMEESFQRCSAVMQ